MFRTLDVVLIAVMTAAATVTYSLKHQAENKQEEVRKLDAEIKLEEDTIDLLKADWALLTQPNRLNRLVTTFAGDLKLVPTESTQLAQPNELPMPMAELPALEPAKDAKADAKVADGKKNTKKKSTDAIQTGSVAN
ncbi:cell division protein FtsL [Shinella sp. M27]|uniref:cell division protein FtsL n=1 Tax=Shinella sp. M27 TaxID=3368614 RepID=UPI003B9EDE0D